MNNQLGGINRENGAFVTDEAHIRSSVADILTTPKGSRLYHRTYGSDLFDLLDRPKNHTLKVDVMAAVAEALMLFEPRIKVNAVTIDNTPDSQLIINIYASHTASNEPVTIEGVRLK